MGLKKHFRFLGCMQCPVTTMLGLLIFLFYADSQYVLSKTNVNNYYIDKNFVNYKKIK